MNDGSKKVITDENNAHKDLKKTDLLWPIRTIINKTKQIKLLTQGGQTDYLRNNLL